jgi:hypothetical protein
MEEKQRAESLERSQQILSWVIEQRAALLSELRAGGLTLFETAAGFRAVQQVKDKYIKPAPLLVPVPGQTEEERLCRQVIAHLETRLQDDLEQPAIVARLEKELQEHLERYGSVHLPASPRLDPPC